MRKLFAGTLLKIQNISRGICDVKKESNKYEVIAVHYWFIFWFIGSLEA